MNNLNKLQIGYLPNLEKISLIAIYFWCTIENSELV